ncbi:glycoside hydrolase TIM-barrel-like domain-containing protein [uncultured Roseobacter sp.]|uniref:baseplate multidomain protein megatron n=1 Tax=uncultured Roseobacter sp. TaxID=114847 RepID=UPI00261BE5F4|nr:glycoside hydrolase TIM-barrel-like domain-containing protein [uncultured Roseobacter sp.]
MATIVLSAVGAAVGGSIGGSVAGLSTAVIGRAVGATLGKVIDQKLLGQGSEAVSTGRVDRFRLSGVGEGEAISQVYGRMRLGGQVIWASDFAETVTVTGGGGGGGKGAPSQPQTRSYSYSVNLALAICEGEITRIGRIWANGEEIAPDDLNLRIYKGNADQLPDPLMEAIEGAGMVPAYRGTAYVVIENLNLDRFGNRVPQFSFEVSRPEQVEETDADQSLTYGVRSVALIPGTGEYSLATTPVHYTNGPGSRWSANVNTPAEKPDFCVSLDALVEELPNCQAASLVVSWFGNDLRCGNCSLQPKVEKKQFEGENMPWSVAGLSRATAGAMAQEDGRPIYGGTPTDQSVIQAIQAMHAAGKEVMFYPFILMDQLSDNALQNPYDPEATQPRLPWRGRITLSIAPGVEGSPDGTASAEAEVNAFFGSAVAAHYSIAGGQVSYSGPQEWTLSRFVLHYAALCKLAGGVEAFCISSEMRGLTQIRGPGNTFVAVERLRALAAQVRSILGPDTKISYAADWSEYFGYQPQDGSNDRFFHLDPLWADPNIDFIGIDNYMPLSDWRDGEDHLDADVGSIYDIEYLQGNVAGGEGYDWYYASQEDQDNQVRTPIEDIAHGEPWIYRYKDIRNWWSNPHHERVDGQRSLSPTAWVPGSKPIWFTEMGCAAIDKGTNEPNKFVDAKSSESSLPKYSNGARDDFMQAQYLKAMVTYWGASENNPSSGLYGGPMIDMDRAFVWAWDARPYPYFPNTSSLWSDSENYGRGHWLNGRTSARSLASVVAEVCTKAGLTDFDASKLYGTVRGYLVDDVNDARASLQPLMLRYSFDAVERDGTLTFKMRDGRGAVTLDHNMLALSNEMDGAVEQSRAAQAEMAGRVRLRFVQADAEFDVLAEEAVLADEQTHSVSTSEMPIALTRVEGRQVAERWLTEARIARDAIRFALPPSCLTVGAGDIVELGGEQTGGKALYRIDRVEQGMLQIVEAVRIEPDVYTPSTMTDEAPSARPVVPPVPVDSLFLDLPLITGDENPYAPHIAVTAQPWPGSVAVYQSSTDSDFKLLSQVSARSIVGTTQTELRAASAGRLDRGAPLEVTLASGSLSSVDLHAALSGANLAAIGDGHPNNWEVFQFRHAELIGEKTYRLSERLRGQLGTDGNMPESWPAGSSFVLLNGLPSQIDLSRNLRRVEQTYRIGPARRPVDDASFIQEKQSFDGNGLRPYAPVHLHAKRQSDGSLLVDWIRRTRVDGDSWDIPEVPLGEEKEAYLVRVIKNDLVVREETTAQPQWQYALQQQIEDDIVNPFTVQVGQISAVYGVGSTRDLIVY